MKISKRKLIFLALLIILICVLYYKKTTNENKTSARVSSQMQKTVIIDPGHGGADPGKVAGKILEKNINLAIAKKLQKYLEENGYKVIMTRSEDGDLPDDKQSEMYKRKIIANSSDADIFVSIHQNSSSSSNAKGAQVYFFKKSNESEILANYVDSSIKKYANPSKKFEPIANTDYYVLRQTTMPAVLVECGFMSNSGERWKLTTKDYQDKMAKAIFNGIDSYFKSN